MALYAIGDIQGCGTELDTLLDAIRFSAAQDRLWFVGDLVNRGPETLRVLRRIKSFGDAAIVTLGNHDLHLLAVSFGCAQVRSDDTLDEILSAPDRDELLGWLTHRPVLHEDSEFNAGLLHAGLAPQWDMALARRCAREFEAALRRNPKKVLAALYGDLPDLWSDDLSGEERLRFIANSFTRLRFVDQDGRLMLRAKGSPKKAQTKSHIPWFDADGARWRGPRVSGAPLARPHLFFGHWSTLGFFKNADVTALDTGCVWGGKLTALRLDAPNASPVQVGCLSR